MKRIHWIVGTICLATALLALHESLKPRPALAQAGKPAEDEEDTDALEQRIRNTVRASGTVISLDSGDVKCQLPEAGRIVELVENGATVRKGDLLVNLDDAPWKDALRTQEAATLAAEAALAQAKAVLALREQEKTDALENGALAIKAAELARERYLGDGGEHSSQLKAADLEREVAQERLKAAETILKAVMEAGESGPAAERQLAEARLAIFEAKAAIQVAEGKKQLLGTRTLAYQTAVLDLALAEAKAARARGIRQGEAALAQATGEVRTREAALLAARSQVDRAKRALEHCVIRAPRDGFVVYAAPRTWRAAGELEAGATVQPGQLLLQMPDMSRPGLRVLISETRVALLAPGQDVAVRLEALPGKVLRGKVMSLASQSEQASWLSSDVRQYAAIVSLQDPPRGLKVGLTALAEINVGDGTREPAPKRPVR